MVESFAKQGHGDGLCGIYSIVNVICKFEENGDRKRDYFRHLIMAAERLGYLDYFHITIGFEAFELKEIIDFVAKNFGHVLSAKILADESQVNKARVPRKYKTGVLLYYSDPIDHWLAEVNGTIMDSSPAGYEMSITDEDECLYGLLIENKLQD